MRGIYLATGALMASVMLSACALLSPRNMVSDADIQATVDTEVATRMASLMTDTAATESAQPSVTATPQPTTAPVPTNPPATPESPTAGDQASAEPESTVEPTPEPALPVEPYDAAGMQVLVTLNAWRISEDLLPYSVNQSLTDLAQAQLDYIMSLPDVPDDIHRGPNGAYPKQRATAVGWPTYHTPDQILIDEIAYIGPNADRALDWWLGSEIHSATLHNPAYREIGVAVADHPYGHLYMIDFGSRPDVLPTLYDPEDGVIFLSAERHEYANGGQFMMQPTTYQIVATLDSLVLPDAWNPWVTRIHAPTDMGSSYVVVYTDGIHETRYTVDQASTILWLPTNITPPQ